MGSPPWDGARYTLATYLDHNNMSEISTALWLFYKIGEFFNEVPILIRRGFKPLLVKLTLNCTQL